MPFGLKRGQKSKTAASCKPTKHGDRQVGDPLVEAPVQRSGNYSTPESSREEQHFTGEAASSGEPVSPSRLPADNGLFSSTELMVWQPSSADEGMPLPHDELCDLISWKLDQVISSIDGEEFAGDEEDLGKYRCCCSNFLTILMDRLTK